jgi:hypothetical protein
MKSVITTALALSLFACCDAYAAFLNTFDNLPENTIVTNQFLPEVSFTGAQVITAGSRLNPAFPPVSDPNVVYDFLDGTITVNFNHPGNGVYFVRAFVTGNTSITESIFRGSTLLGSVSTGGANFVGAGTGIPPNVFLSLNEPDGVGEITRVVFTNNLGTGNTFTLDNFFLMPRAPSPVQAFPA